MASITFWNRIEPRPRSDKLERHLAAQVRDPLWFLTRQWQFGEYQGEDAATPAFVELKARVSPITGWYAPGEPVSPFQNEAPLEELTQTEAFTPEWATAVELGQHYEELLTMAGHVTLISAFRVEYPVPAPADVAQTERDHDLLVRTQKFFGKGKAPPTLIENRELGLFFRERQLLCDQRSKGGFAGRQLLAIATQRKPTQVFSTIFVASR